MASALAELAVDLMLLMQEALPALAARAVHALWLLTQLCTNVRIIQHFDDRPLHEVMPLVMVLLIMGMLYFAFTLCCAPLFGAAFHASFVLALVAYYQGIVTDPGAIPEDWCVGPGVLERLTDKVHEHKRTTGEVRLCKKEHKYKPDRAHYCSQLQRNVLRMDHYCPWLGTCVGHYNYKYFVLFLFYTIGATDVTMLNLIQALASNAYFPGTTAFLFFSAGIAALLSLLLTPFLLLHLWLLGRNMTTLEFCERICYGDGSYASPYDVGVFSNIQSALGKDMCLWLLPVGEPDGDGLTWPRRPATDSGAAAGV